MFSKSKKIFIKKVKEYGIGNKIKENIFKKIGVNTRVTCSNYKTITINNLEKLKKNLFFGKSLLLKNKKRKNFLIGLNTFKGLRHQLKKPVRGQRTKTNAKTARKINIFNEKNPKTTKNY